jgi:hypothetical protein
LGGTFHAGPLQSYGGEGFSAEPLEWQVEVEAIVGRIRARRRGVRNAAFVPEKGACEGRANELTGFLPAMKTLLVGGHDSSQRQTAAMSRIVSGAEVALSSDRRAASPRRPGARSLRDGASCS